MTVILSSIVGSAAALCCALAAFDSSHVIIVAPSGGSYTDIQPAIDAADNGDTVLVKPGTYSGFTIFGRARLDVVADVGGVVQVNGSVHVINCTGYVVLSGMSVRAVSSIAGPDRHGISIENNTGPVRILSCSFQGAEPLMAPFPCAGGRGGYVVGSHDVEFSACTLNGSRFGGYDTSAGLVVSSSSVALYDSLSLGGDSTCGTCGYAGWPGGDGIDVLNSSFVFASRSTFTGGHGTNTGPGGADAGYGGTGIVVTGASNVQMLDCVPTGGAGGVYNVTGGNFFCGCGCCALCCSCWYDGSPGAATAVAPGSVLGTIAGAGRSLWTPNVVRETSPVSLQIGGQAGDFVSLAIASKTAFEWQPLFSGVSLTTQTSPRRWMIIGTIGASGFLNTSVAIPDLGPGVLARNWYVQTMHRDTVGRHLLGSGRTVVLLDSSL